MLQRMQIIGQLLDMDGITFDENGQATMDLIQIRNVDGLDPVNATINTTSYDDIDGGFFTGASVGPRNIVLTCGYNPDYNGHKDISDLRKILYQYFTPKRQTQFIFFDSAFTGDLADNGVQIFGYVESMNANIFSADPEVQVSVICPDPDFVGVIAAAITGSVSAGDPTYQWVDYEGNAETPIVLQVSTSATEYNGSMSILSLIGINSDASGVTIDDVDITTDLYFELDSSDGNKTASSVNSIGLRTNLLRGINSSAVWPKIVPGGLWLAVAGTTDVTDDLTWQINYYPRFTGL